MTKEQFIQMLRDAAEFFESRPDLPRPDGVMEVSGSLAFYYYGDCGTFDASTPEGLARFAKIVGGRLNKIATDDCFGLEVDRGSFAVKAVSYNRENFCERVQVGTKVEPEHIIPAREEEVVPEREVPVYEWRCKPILADAPELEAAQ